MAFSICGNISVKNDSKLYENCKAEVSQRSTIGYFSLFGSSYEVCISQSNAKKFSKEKFQNLEERLKGVLSLDITENPDDYVRRNHKFNRIQPIITWCMMQMNGGKTLSEATANADFVIDRTALSKIAVTPYDDTLTFGWQLQCRRIGKTIFICPYKITEEEESFCTDLGVKNSFIRDRLIHLVTEPYDNSTADNHGKIDGNNTYHSVSKIYLSGSEKSAKFSILYVSQVDIIDPDDEQKPIEVRCHKGNLGGDEYWYRKTLRWYLQFVFSGSEKVLVGRKSTKKDTNHIMWLKFIPVTRFREDALLNKAWSDEACFSYLYHILKTIHQIAQNLPEGKALIVTNKPNSEEATFNMCNEDEPSFIPQEFIKICQKF